MSYIKYNEDNIEIAGERSRDSLRDDASTQKQYTSVIKAEAIDYYPPCYEIVYVKQMRMTKKDICCFLDISNRAYHLKLWDEVVNKKPFFEAMRRVNAILENNGKPPRWTIQKSNIKLKDLLLQLRTFDIRVFLRCV